MHVNSRSLYQSIRNIEDGKKRKLMLAGSGVDLPSHAWQWTPEELELFIGAFACSRNSCAKNLTLH